MRGRRRTASRAAIHAGAAPRYNPVRSRTGGTTNLELTATPEPRIRPAPSLRLARELCVIPEWLTLHISPVYFGVGVPHGAGSPVVVVPGFLTSDRYLAEMYEWLRRVGYRPYYSGIGRNVDCPDLLTRRLLLTIEQAHLETGERVRVIGHSLGGTLAAAAAIRMPERVAQVITLGSPLAAADVHPIVLAAKDLVHWRIHRGGEVAHPECFTDRCGCEFAASAGKPLPPAVRRTAIYSKRDNIVEWKCCLFPEEDANIEVKSTHIGLAFNARVYRTIARVLAGNAR